MYLISANLNEKKIMNKFNITIPRFAHKELEPRFIFAFSPQIMKLIYNILYHFIHVILPNHNCMRLTVYPSIKINEINSISFNQNKLFFTRKFTVWVAFWTMYRVMLRITGDLSEALWVKEIKQFENQTSAHSYSPVILNEIFYKIHEPTILFSSALRPLLLRITGREECSSWCIWKES